MQFVKIRVLKYLNLHTNIIYQITYLYNFFDLKVANFILYFNYLLRGLRLVILILNILLVV